MTPRDPGEEHRAATPLELFFDLVFVVAIAVAALDLHHGIVEGHASAAIRGYALAFFGIWWAWVNFTWFASAYETDDVRYRLLVFIMMTGALVFASGVSGFAEGNYDRVVWGYVVMRVALVILWLRAAAGDPERSTTAYRYAIGVAAVQVFWVAFLYVSPNIGALLLPALVALELAVPLWAEAAQQTPWHAEHIAERYGLLTIIVLGESVLAATGTIRAAFATGLSATLLPPVAGGLLILYSMWWLYFETPRWDLLTGDRTAFVWGYVHYFVFAACAAVGPAFRSWWMF